MTLKDMKQKALRLIEEIAEGEKLTNDPDIEEKINDVINQIQFELARIKKKLVHEEQEVVEGQILDLLSIENFYQLKVIRMTDEDGDAGSYELMDNLVMFNNTGTAHIFYYVYPPAITKETTDDYKFELTMDVLEIMPYGIAADLLKSDVSTSYGSVYAQRYEDLKQLLDPRHALASISFEGGVDV